MKMYNYIKCLVGTLTVSTLLAASPAVADHTNPGIGENEELFAITKYSCRITFDTTTEIDRANRIIFPPELRATSARQACSANLVFAKPGQGNRNQIRSATVTRPIGCTVRSGETRCSLDDVHVVIPKGYQLKEVVKTERLTLNEFFSGCNHKAKSPHIRVRQNGNGVRINVRENFSCFNPFLNSFADEDPFW